MAYLDIRRTAAAIGLAMAFVAAPIAAQGLSSILDAASDGALNKLSQPGAFFADQAVRIALPGPLRGAGGLMKFADQAGATRGLSKSINDAAGIAAGEAKPIFRAAISRMSVRDGVGILSKPGGGTAYLRESAGTELGAKVRPLIVNALGKVGAFGQLDSIGGSAGGLLKGAGISRDGLTDSVTRQTMDGIFKYMGDEEAHARSNPMGVGKSLLGKFGR